ncbi:unnamed protein product [Thlaspi arvense]|uniref:MIP18 family-like domain-containing protein n=1 Tax=Thlaspi arvense TaxID=13288 RepID=A0AAU9S5Q3_THLAR|nr:unnamed protein product [Thlaspi arvense]
MSGIHGSHDSCPLVKNILLLDSEGNRVAVEYYSDDWSTNAAKLSFEKYESSKTSKTNARTEDIKDPEHTELSLEELHVVTEESVEVDNDESYVRITFTPTVPHCHMPKIIGLCSYAILLQSLPPRFKVDVRVTPGSHADEAAGTKHP